MVSLASSGILVIGRRYDILFISGERQSYICGLILTNTIGDDFLAFEFDNGHRLVVSALPSVLLKIEECNKGRQRARI